MTLSFDNTVINQTLTMGFSLHDLLQSGTTNLLWSGQKKVSIQKGLFRKILIKFFWKADDTTVSLDGASFSLSKLLNTTGSIPIIFIIFFGSLPKDGTLKKYQRFTR